MAVVSADIILSALHQSTNSPVMPLYSHMLRVCKTGTDKAWADKRTMARREKTAKMPSMGRQRIRPGALRRMRDRTSPPQPLPRRGELDEG